MMTHKSNTPNPKVAAWAESMGYKRSNVGNYFVSISDKINYEQMTFMYHQMVQARIDELEKASWSFDTHYYEQRIAELKAELQELEEEK